MSQISIFEVLGPVMIGPSSSHTAGAARLGKVAADIAGRKPVQVRFFLHGSFAKTYKGHGTDKALAAGVLGMSTYDERLRDSLDIAEKQGIRMEFIEADLGDCHENTAKMEFTFEDGSVFNVTGSSLGGGRIMITNVDGYPTEITGDYPTIMIRHLDRKGMISRVTAILAAFDINIGLMKVVRQQRGKEASMIIESDENLSDQVVIALRGIDGILSVRKIDKV